MSGVISVGAAVASIGIAGATIGAAGGAITLGGAFAITAAVGATLGAVGALTKVKELQYAGAALGAVGLVGGLASAAGLFGEAGALFGAANEVVSAGAQIAGGTGEAASAASAAADAGGLWANVTPVALSSAPTTGYAGVPGGSEQWASNVAPDVIDMVNGVPQVSTGTPEVATALAPDVTPTVASDTIGGADSTMRRIDNIGQFESPTKGFDFSASQYGEPAAPSVKVTGDVPDPAKGLASLGESSPLDQFGNPIAQGQEAGGAQIGPGVRNPAAAPNEGWNTPTVKPAGLVNATPAATTPTTTPTGPLSDLGASAASANAASQSPQFAGGVSGGIGQLKPGPSAWSSITDFVQKNQTLSYGAMQTVGSFISGVATKTPQSVIDELNSRSAQNQAAENLYNKQAELIQRRLDNMNAPFPMATRRPTGLMDSGVTGRIG